MELRAYLAILWRRRWFLVLLPALSLIAVLVQVLQYQARYTAQAAVLITRLPQQAPAETFRYDEYYLYLTNEYTVDDFTEVLRGNVFATDVAQRASQLLGTSISTAEVQAGLSVTRRNRAVLLSITAGEPERAVALARAAVAALRERGTAYFGFTDPSRQVIVQVIDEPQSAVPDTARAQLLWVLQVVLAVAAGVFLAFLAEYFSDTLDSADDVRRVTGLPVLAIVPDGSRRWGRAT